jgi:spore coat protein A
MSRHLSRRTFLGLTGGAGVVLAAGIAGPRLLAQGSQGTGELLRSGIPLPEPFRVPLPIPRVLRPQRMADADHYTITQRAATAEILPERELPLMIADRAFDEHGAFAYPALDRTLRTTPGVESAFVEGVFGDVILVNGAPWPVHEVAAVRYRLRVLNASNARRYDLALDPPPPGGGGLVQIGSDQGLLDTPRSHDHLPIAPAERYDLVVDFGRYPVGTQVTLVNRLGTGSTAQVMRFTVTRREPDESRIPLKLSEITPLTRSQATTTREFSFRGGHVHGRAGWLIGGEPFSPDRMAAGPRLGDVEIWRFVADLHHPVHLHLVGFHVLSRGGGPPGPFDGGIKDTVDLSPGESVEVIARFDGYRGRYVFHCHNAEHEDMAMMANFEVI